MNLLEKANDLIYGDRHGTYGPYDEEAKKIAQVFSIILGFEVPVEKVPLLMVGLKMVRLSNTPTHTDSWVDIAGYAGCAGKLPTIWPEIHPEEEVSLGLKNDPTSNTKYFHKITPAE